MSVTDRENRLLKVLVGLADTLVSDFDVADLFYQLVETCKELLGVSEAALLLAEGNGTLRVVAATSEGTHVVQLMELENEGGPGLEAFNSKQPVTSGALDGDSAQSRWPAFASRAASEGFTRVWAFPMRLRNETLGALSLLQRDEEDLSQEDTALAAALAHMATISIIQHRTANGDQALIGQLQTALDTRVVIEQAKGIVAQQTGLAMDEAFGQIREHARNKNTQLRTVAAMIVSGVLTAHDLASPD